MIAYQTVPIAIGGEVSLINLHFDRLNVTFE